LNGPYRLPWAEGAFAKSRANQVFIETHTHGRKLALVGRTSVAASAVSATDLVEGDAPLNSAEKGFVRPKADVLPAAPEPVDAICIRLKVLERHARRPRAALGHQRVQHAESVWVEPAQALRVPVIHP
jgi:hypothetical protein